MALQLRFVSHSEVGPVRKNNQDSGFAGPQLLVVADGMGGAAAGDLASAVAVDTIRVAAEAPVTDPAAAPQGSGTPGELIASQAPTAPGAAEAAETPGEPDTAGPSPMLDRLSTLVHEANDRIAALIAADHHLEGMGTTVTGALFDGEKFGLVHIGDSRAYLYRDGRLERLTHDHSWVQSLVDDGKISEAEAAVHPHRSLLLRVLNGQPANDPDITTVTARPGDRLLFCSDGVCGLVDDPDIADAMALPSAADALARLVDEALLAGGIDNITAIVADVVDGDGAGEVAVLGAAAEREIPSVEALAARQAEDTLVRPLSEEDEDDEPAGAVATPARDDEERYRPQAPTRFRLLRPLVGLLVVVLIAGAALGIGYAWTRTQYYVGQSGTQVAIFQGLPEGLPGVALSQVFEIQELDVATLPAFYRQQLAAGIEVSSLDAARQTVAQLRTAVGQCPPPASASSQPSGSTTSSTSTPPTTKPTPTTGATTSAGAVTTPPASGTPRTTPKSTPKSTSAASPSPSGTSTTGPGC